MNLLELVPTQARPIRRGVAPSALRPSDICVTGSYDNGRLCFDIPVLGQQCVNIGGPPISAAAKVCCSLSVFPPGATCCAFINNTKLGCFSV